MHKFYRNITLQKEQLLMYFSSKIQDQFSHNIKTNIKFHNTSRILIENDDENYMCMSYDYIIKLKCIEKNTERKIYWKMCVGFVLFSWQHDF